MFILKDKGIVKFSKNLGKLIFPLCIMAFILFEGRSIFKGLDFRQVMDIINKTPKANLIIFFITAVVAVTCLCAYDMILSDYYNFQVPLKKTCKISWVCVTFNNIIGLGGLTGASIRTYLFKKENIKTTDLINYNMILVPSTIIGLGILSLLSVFNIFNTHDILKVYPWLWLAILAFTAVIPLYFFLGNFQWLNNKLKKFNLYFEGSLNIKLKLTLISTIDWISRGLLFYIIAKNFNANVNVLSAIGIDVIASVAGLISFIPSGIGSYDVVALMGLSILGYAPNIALSVILLFRVFYFVIPWAIGGVLMLETIIKPFLKYR